MKLTLDTRTLFNYMDSIESINNKAENPITVGLIIRKEERGERREEGGGRREDLVCYWGLIVLKMP